MDNSPTYHLLYKIQTCIQSSSARCLKVKGTTLVGVTRGTHAGLGASSISDRTNEWGSIDEDHISGQSKTAASLEEEIRVVIYHHHHISYKDKFRPARKLAQSRLVVQYYLQLAASNF